MNLLVVDAGAALALVAAGALEIVVRAAAVPVGAAVVAATAV